MNPASARADSGRATALVRSWVAAFIAVLLAGCASLARPPLPGDTLSGRLAVRVAPQAGNDARAMSASFELSGTPEAGRLDLTSPLGTVVAQARWAPGEVVLATTDSKTTFSDLDALTREVLGESLPVAALFDWLRGRPWPGAPNRVQPAGFEQLGWEVSLARFDEGIVSAERQTPPAVTVRAKVDK